MPTYNVPLARIPLLPAQHQAFSINLNGTTYRMRLTYNDADTGGNWVLDIGDAQGTPMIAGIPLIPDINLLNQYEYLQIGQGGALFVHGNVPGEEYPTFEGLGDTWQLYFAFPNSFGSNPTSGLSNVPPEFIEALDRASTAVIASH